MIHFVWDERFFLSMEKCSVIRHGQLCSCSCKTLLQPNAENDRVYVRDDERCGRSKEIRTPELIGQRVRVRVTIVRFLGSSGRDSVGRGQHSSNRVSGISTRTMHQSTTPSLSQTIWQRRASRQFLTLPIVQTLLPVTFANSLSSEAVVMRQLRRWKRLWRRSLITWKGTRVSCVYYQ